MIFLLCHAYNNWIDRRITEFPDKSLEIYDLEWRFYLSILESTIEICCFVSSLIILDQLLISSNDKTNKLSRKDFVVRSFMGFYGRGIAILLWVIEFVALR